jgi:phosphohistidine phosphatase
MKTLTLLRHAKSGWDDPVARDFDRPLNKRGERASHIIGTWMRDQKMAFDHVVASPAVRVIDTLDQIVKTYGALGEPTWERRIYLASSASLMDVLRETEDTFNNVLMVGHNPGLEDLILDLVPERKDDPLRALVYYKYPTAAVAEIDLAIDTWTAIDRGCGVLKRYIRPRDLDPELGPEDE